MKDPDRLLQTGTDEERRLLRSAQALPVPTPLADQVRRRVEARLIRRPPIRLLLGIGLLVAGAATAFPLWRSLQPEPARAPTPVRAPTGPQIVAQPSSAEPEPAPAPEPAFPRSPAPRRLTPSPASPPTPVESPTLDLPGFRRGAADPAPAATPPAPTPRLTIARANRHTIALEASATRVRGWVRGRSIDLTLDGRQLTGKIGDDAVMIRIFGKARAEGHAGGVELAFGFVPTERGWLVNAALPDVGGRVQLDDRRLAFDPGCDEDLPAVQGVAGAYSGRCDDGTIMRIELPPAFQEMNPLARLVILGLLLPEPDPVLRGKERGLFPAP